MELLADESCTGPVIRAFARRVTMSSPFEEVAKGISDEKVIERAFKENRVLITEDRDFGELVYARGFASAGVVYLKFHRRARGLKPGAAVEAFEKIGNRLSGRFVVVAPGRVRIAQRPPR